MSRTLVVIALSARAAVAAEPAADQAPPSVQQVMQVAGLVDVQTISSTIRVDLKYAGADNFLHANVYGDLEGCYLQPDVAKKLSIAQKILRRSKPGWSLLTYDCARPARIQRKMWELVKNTDKAEYVVSPDKGSNHNFGAAVDLTLADESGRPLDMGTPFDFFGELAQPRLEDDLRKAGKLTGTQVANRRILRDLMRAAGFRGIPNEWWHFDSAKHDDITAAYHIIE